MNINGYTPKRKLTSKHLVTLQQSTPEDIFEFLHFARDIKRKKSVDEKLNCLKGKYVTLLTKPDFVRSRIAFNMAVNDLEGTPIVVPLTGSAIEEELKDPDTTTVIKNFGVSAFVVDTSFMHDAEVLNTYSDVPTVNANGRSSPCQPLAALLTIWEHKGKLEGLRLAIIGNVNDGDYSLLAGASKCGMDISIVCPDDFDPPRKILDYCSQFGFVDIYDNIEDGVRGADVIFIMDHDFDKKYLFTDRYFKYANKEALLLHSMPINRGGDISEEALNYPGAIIFEQAGNVLPDLQSVLALLAGKITD